MIPTAPDPLLAGYGETGALHRSIPLSGAGAVQVHGSGVPPGHSVWLAGTPVPIDEHGNFVAEAVLPKGMHTVEVAVLDPSGSGELFLRDLELERNDWFYVGIADLTLSGGKTSGPEEDLQGSDSTFDRDSMLDGRLAFFLKGRFGEDWSLTAHADTREGPVEDLFKDFVDKTPEALFRRIDSDYFYPTFGDDGTVEEGAATSGKFFVKLSQRENHAMWGNFKVGYLENELAQVDRGLYGANLHYQTLAATRFGEPRVVLDGFAAQPGTVPSREEFRGTGGSLYYLRVQDLLEGSERTAHRDPRQGLGPRHRCRAPAADPGLRHRLPAGARAAQRAALGHRERQQPRAQPGPRRRRGVARRPVRVHAGHSTSSTRSPSAARATSG